MMEKHRIMEIPPKQRMARQESLAREHSVEYKAALQRAVALEIPLAQSPSQYGTFNETRQGETSGGSEGESSILQSNRGTEGWDDFVKRFFDFDESGQVVFKRPASEEFRESFVRD